MCTTFASAVCATLRLAAAPFTLVWRRRRLSCDGCGERHLETEIAARQRRSSDERESVTRLLAKAEAERKKLLDAYYAGAVDVDAATPKIEQARIGIEARSAEDRLAAVEDGLAEQREVLESAMGKAANCGKAYGLAGHKTRRRFNHAVINRIEVREGRIVNVAYQQPFDVLFRASEFEYGDSVGRRGLEPLTPCASCKCATNCANGPTAGCRA